MPSVRVHCAISRERTGRSFEELHRWIDEYTEELGAEHRSRRHHWNKNNQTFIKQWFDRREKGLGKIAVEEWIFHIVLDNLSTLFKYNRRNNPMKERNNIFLFGILNNGFINYKEAHVDEKGMSNLFSIISDTTKEITEFTQDMEDFFDEK